MKKCWVNRFYQAGVALVISTVLFGTMSSCTKTDDTVGNGDFIPEGGDYKVYQDVIPSGFTIKTNRVDSISSDDFTAANLSNSGVAIAYLGSQVTAREGQINYSFVTQTSPYSATEIADGNAPFGSGLVIDSAFFRVGISDYLGEPDQNYTVEVYELKKDLPYGGDSTYYSNFDITEYISDQPLYSFNSIFGNQIEFKIPLDSEHLKKLMSLSGETYKSYTSFRSHFKGYYIKTSSVMSGNRVSIILPQYSGIYVYYHNNEKADASLFVTDFQRFTEPDIYTQTTYLLNKSFNKITRDYNYKDPLFGVQFVENEVATISYASGMAGLMTTLEITDNVINQIKEKIASRGGGDKILVSNATLVIPCGDTSIRGLDEALTELGGYKQYQPIINVNAQYEKDISYILEDYYSGYNTIGTFNGVLNRASGEYRINISSTIQGLINGKQNNRTIQIAPGYKQKESTDVAVLENSASRPIRLEITYGVVK